MNRKNTSKNLNSRYDLLGVPIDSLTELSAADRLQMLMEKRNSLICTPNAEFVVLAQKDPEFKEILEKSSLNCADGIGPLWAMRYLTWKSPRLPIIRELVIIFEWILSIIVIPFCPGLFRYPIPERLSGSDFIWTIAKFAAKNNYKLFLLGGAPTVAERTSLVLQTQINNLRVAGVHSGSPKDTPEIIEAINRSHADILLVAFGAPKQEKWLSENLSKTTCHIGVGLGGTFDFIAEIRKRAPFWMRRSGLEWLYRLIREPRRIVRQMALPKFLYLVLIKRLRSRTIIDVTS